MPAKRLFIAVDISDEARQRAADHMDDLRDIATDVRVGWERPEKLHITLKFLGNVDQGRVSVVSEIVASGAARNGPFAAELVGPGVFPNARQPRVLWLGVSDNGLMRRIAAELGERLQKIGFETETRRFSPHLTIARIREPQKGKRLAEEHLQSRFEPVEFPVREIVLYESILKPTGSVYSVVSRHAL
jgi:2'-5' RNA ligase